MFVKNSTAVMRLFILGLISLLLTNCASNKHDINDSGSYKSVNQHYTNVNSSANILYNYTLSKRYSLSKEDKEKQRDTVFYVLNNLDEGKVAKWYNEEKESWGAVKVVATFPTGTGYCRILFSEIGKKDKSRFYKETACKDLAYYGWRFIR